ncbi:MAG: DUF5615 family PIN-like protein [Smithellaceae bacterium]|nr:DUF5615 family PIN-like protein [Smithellaceae bacterium]
MPDNYRLYLDQMLTLDVSQALKEEGHDTIRALEIGQSRADDKMILAQDISQNRILITLDEHFGDWVVLPLSRHPGVIRLKIHPTTSENAISLLLPFLHCHSPKQFKDRLVILSPKRAKWILTCKV